MRPVKVLTDSVSEIPKVWREQYDIDYLMCYINWDGKDLPANVDWELYSPQELYNALRAGSRITTAQITAQEITEKFTRYAEEGKDIVYVACSGALSASVHVAEHVSKSIIEKYPECTIRCVDSKMAVGGLALLAVEAAKLAAGGMDANAVADQMEKECPCMHQWATVETLTYLKRAGRIKAGAAFFGNLFGIKPILISDANGMNYAIQKIKGRKNALDYCVEQLKKAICYDGNPHPVSEQTIYLGHADCPDDAAYVKEQIEKLIAPKEVFVNPIGPIVGTTTGPGTVAAFGFGTPVTVVGENS